MKINRISKFFNFYLCGQTLFRISVIFVFICGKKQTNKQTRFRLDGAVKTSHSATFGCLAATIILYFFTGELLNGFSEIFLCTFNGSFFCFPLNVGLFSGRNPFSVGKQILIILCQYFTPFAHVRIRTLMCEKKTLFSTFCSCANSHTSVRKKKNSVSTYNHYA